MWDPIENDSNELIYKTETNREQTCGCGGVGEGRGGFDWEFGAIRFKLLYIEWINNKILLHNTGKYIHYLVISHNGKEYVYSYVLFLLVTQSCLTLQCPLDCNPPDSSVHVISQARILEWVTISLSRGSSQPRDRTQVSRIGRWILYN